MLPEVLEVSKHSPNHGHSFQILHFVKVFFFLVYRSALQKLSNARKQSLVSKSNFAVKPGMSVPPIHMVTVHSLQYISINYGAVFAMKMQCNKFNSHFSCCGGFTTNTCIEKVAFIISNIHTENCSTILYKNLQAVFNVITCNQVQDAFCS